MFEFQDPSIPDIVLATVVDKRVWDVHFELQRAVDEMDRKVELVMQKHQSQFLYAYRIHIHKIRKQLQQIKKKSQQQQKLFSSNDRIRYLEKQVAVFREEAINLYEVIEKKSLELTIAKQKSMEAQLACRKMEAENKSLAIELKKIQSSELDYKKSIEQLEKKIQDQNTRFRALELKLASQRQRRNFMDSTKERASSLVKSRQHSPKQFHVHRNQLQDWFLQCVKTIKKQVQQRKNGLDSLKLNKIATIQDFRLVDKLRLFQLLLQNEKLLNWLYHKIFPDKFDKITQYLSESQALVQSQVDIKSQVAKSDRYAQSQQGLQLPKVGSKKIGQLSVRNQIIIKNGRMSISNL